MYIAKSPSEAKSRGREAQTGRSRCQHMDLARTAHGCSAGIDLSTGGIFFEGSVRRASKASMRGVDRATSRSWPRGDGHARKEDKRLQNVPNSGESLATPTTVRETSRKEDRAAAAALSRRVPMAATTRGPAEWPNDHAHGLRRDRGRGQTLLDRCGGRFDLAYANVADWIGVSRDKFRQLLPLASPDAHAQNFSRAVDGDIDPFFRGHFVWLVPGLRFQANPFVVVG